MSTKQPNGKPYPDIKINAIDFETIGNLVYLSTCIRNSDAQRYGSPINIIIDETIYDFDRLRDLVIYLNENDVAIASLNVGDIDDLIDNFTSQEEVLVVSEELPKCIGEDGICQIYPDEISDLQSNDVLSSLWAINRKVRETASLERLFDLPAFQRPTL